VFVLGIDRPGSWYFEAYECYWLTFHALFYEFGACSASDSLDSTDDSGCVENDSGNFFFDGDTTIDLLCDESTSSPSPFSSPFSSESPDNVFDSAFTTSPVSLVYVFIIAALAVFGLQ